MTQTDNNINLIIEAQKRFPIGTVFRNCCGSLSKYTVNDSYFKYGDNFNISVGVREENDSDYRGCVYYNGKWAEIISYPEGYKVERNINNYSIF